MSTTTPARAPHKITKITLADNTLGDAYSGASLSTTALGLRYVQCCGGHHVGGNPLISTDPKFKYLACSLTGDNASYAQGRWYLLAEVDKCDACDHVFCMNLDPELSCRYSAGQPSECSLDGWLGEVRC